MEHRNYSPLCTAFSSTSFLLMSITDHLDILLFVVWSERVGGGGGWSSKLIWTVFSPVTNNVDLQ